MGADKSFLNAEGMWYGGNFPMQVGHLKQWAATAMPGEKKSTPDGVGGQS
jgi:hypothetical protein